jgi:glycosyltransferase involved in cell wall biosynthesis
MTRIGLDARLTYYRIGGISTYIRRLVTALEQLEPDSRFTVFASRKARESLVTRFRQAALWTPAHHRLERLALSAELARFRLDLLHSPDFIPPLRGARRHVITVHDLNFLHYPQFLTAESRRYYNDQIAAAVRQADHILADSEATKADLIALLDVPAAKITVHLLGVDESFRPLPPAALEPVRQRLDLPPAYILFVGTFEPRKNVSGLLDAYRLLLADLPDAPPLVLAGPRGWLFDETFAKAARLGLGERVLWRENIPQADLPALYNLAAVLVLPSYYEGFGFPPLEAMACGTIPVVSDRSSLPEVVGPVGLQAAPDDPAALAAALWRALTDAPWRADMRRAGLERAAAFTWARTARTALSVYRAALN